MHGLMKDTGIANGMFRFTCRASGTGQNSTGNLAFPFLQTSLIAPLKELLRTLHEFCWRVINVLTRVMRPFASCLEAKSLSFESVF